MSLEITLANNSFSDWPSLLALLHKAFSYMDDRIDPPSSLRLLTPESIATKAQDELLFVATNDGELVGCVFAAPRNDSYYIGKLAVHPDHQRKGVGQRLMEAIEYQAADKDFDTLELDTRIELTENHSAFESMGFIVTGKHSHKGHNRPTFISMRKVLTHT